MDLHEYRETAYNIIRLIAGLLNEREASALPLDDLDAEKLFAFAKRHSLCAITDAALKARGVRFDAFTVAGAQATQKSVLLDMEYRRITRQLEKNRIRYLPLKGILLKQLYPKPWMREMSDIDLLIAGGMHEAVRDIMTDSGYTVRYYDYNNEDVYKKAPFYRFEMHRTLFDRDRFPAIQQYYDNRQYLPDGDSPYRLRMTVEEEYIYLITHVFVHYTVKGTGLRSLLDLYLFLERYGGEMDFSRIENELAQFGADEFERSVRRLSREFLRIDELDDALKDELDYYISSGVYGTKKQYYQNRIAQETSDSSNPKAAYIFKRLRVPDQAIEKHPFYQKHPRLVPLMTVSRIAKAVVKNPKEIAYELKVLFKNPPEEE